MSKLMTDSQFMMDFLFKGVNAEDTPLSINLGNLKQATFNCTELRVICEYEDPETIRKKIDEVNTVLVETWHNMLAMRNDFKDLIDSNFKE